MNEVWNLDPIYKGFDDPAFEADLAQLKKAAAEMGETMAKLSRMEPIEGLKAGVAAQEETSKLVQKLYGYASLPSLSRSTNLSPIFNVSFSLVVISYTSFTG